LFMAPFSQDLEPPQNPGRFKRLGLQKVLQDIDAQLAIREV